MKILVLLGKSASGKDFIMNKLVKEYGFKRVISHTTRPIRNGETNGKEYYFISLDKFLNMNLKDNFIECREYNTQQGLWYYGLSKHEIDLTDDNKYVVILDFNGLKALEGYLKSVGMEDKLTSVYIEAKAQVRLQRSLNREGEMTDEQVMEVIRRLEADERDFEGAKEYADLTFTNNLGEAMIVNPICETINQYVEWIYKIN